MVFQRRNYQVFILGGFTMGAATLAGIMFIWVVSCFGLFMLLKEDQKKKVINYVNKFEGK
jgi:hypothetical protein